MLISIQIWTLLNAVLLQLFLNTCSCVPSDWASLVSNNEMLFSASQPSDGFYPNIGNGFLAMNLGCATNLTETDIHTSNTQLSKTRCGNLFMSGVYNGNNSNLGLDDGNEWYANTSKRALIPGIYSYYIDTSELSDSDFNITWLGAGLYLPNGTFHNRSYVYHPDLCATGAEVELVTYTHRFYKSLLVWEARIVRWGDESVDTMNSNDSDDFQSIPSCSVPLRHCNQNWTYDFNWNQWQSQDLIIRNFTTLIAETPDTPLVSVAAAFQPVLGADGVGADGRVGEDQISLTLTQDVNETVTYYAVLHNSLDLDTGITDATELAQYCESELTSYINDYEYESILSKHTTAMNALWNLRIDVEGNDTISKGVYASLFYILNALRADYPMSTSPGGTVSNDYYGHVFWDAETWMLPTLAAIYPSLAASMLQYRLDRLPAAQSFATTTLGLDTSVSAYAQFPWESAFSGSDICQIPLFGSNEIHVVADVALALELVYKLNSNSSWLFDTVNDRGQSYWNMLNYSCNYLSRRATQLSNGYYTFHDVITADESAGLVNTSAYTNLAAAKAVAFCGDVAQAAGAMNMDGTPGDEAINAWYELASRVEMILSDSTDVAGNDGGEWIVLEYDGYNGSAINQADVILLYYPLQSDTVSNFFITQWNVSGTTINLNKNNLLYYESRTSVGGTQEYFTGDSSYSVAWLKLAGNAKYLGPLSSAWNASEFDYYLRKAGEFFDAAWGHMDVDNYYVWKEKLDTDNGGNLNFLTGAGGLLQNVLFGYVGASVDYDSLLLSPELPVGRNVSRICVNAMVYQGVLMRFEFDSQSMKFYRYSKDEIMGFKEALLESFINENVGDIGNNISLVVEVVKPVKYVNETSKTVSWRLEANETRNLGLGESVEFTRHLCRVSVVNESAPSGVKRIVIGGGGTGGAQSEAETVYYWVIVGCIGVFSVTVCVLLVAYRRDILKLCKKAYEAGRNSVRRGGRQPEHVLLVGVDSDS